MIGERIKKIRKDKGFTLEELGQRIGKSPSVLSRMETQESYTIDSKLLEKIADTLGVSLLFLLSEEEAHYEDMEKVEKLEEGETIVALVRDDEMRPEIPEGAFLKIRGLKQKEKLQAYAFYCIAFNKQKKIRMAIEDEEEGLGFLPMTLSERRILYDPEYVDVLGKVTEMKVIFEDDIY